ncbi:MAG: hypothetical protein HUJ65_06335 [Oscillospiraceae bacterium]|nr:hypothetical protein [Oscillospiraceae bacterium]
MLGDIPWLSWKSKSAQEKESEEYEKWAFPYGQPQRDKIEAILKELLPKEKPQIALIAFLTCKEIFGRSYTGDGMYDYALKRTKKDVKRYKTFVRKKDAPKYVALAVADVMITSDLEYPSMEKLQRIMDEYEALPDEKSGFLDFLR